MNGGLITSADAILVLSIAGLYPDPQQIQGFATEEAFDFGDVELVETMLGVDGNLSAGWVPVTFTQSITLQADSDSNELFEQWQLAQAQAQTPFIATGTVILPSTKKQYSLTKGFFKGFNPVPSAKKVLQPRKYSILWNKVTAAPFVGI